MCPLWDSYFISSYLWLPADRSCLFTVNKNNTHCSSCTQSICGVFFKKQFLYLYHSSLKAYFIKLHELNFKAQKCCIEVASMFSVKNTVNVPHIFNTSLPLMAIYVNEFFFAYISFSCSHPERLFNLANSRIIIN